MSPSKGEQVDCVRGLLRLIGMRPVWIFLGVASIAFTSVCLLERVIFELEVFMDQNSSVFIVLRFGFKLLVGFASVLVKSFRK
jgi:hypothetical protein